MTNSILAALVNGTLIGAGLAFTVWTTLRLMPRNSLNAATRYAIWWAVLVVIVAMPFSYYHSVDSDYRETVSPAVAPAGASLFIGSTPLTRRSVQAVASSKSAASTRASTIPSWGSLPFRPTFPIGLSASAWPTRILITWIAIAGLMLIRLPISILMLERRKARASNAAPALAARVSVWAAQCGGSRRRIRLAISRETFVPLAAGPWHPAILLPSRLLTELSECDLDRIGIHEMAHLVRRDDYTLLIQRTVEALFVLHPLVRWISHRIDLEREIACDDFVLSATGDSGSYASCLTRIVELSGGIHAMPIAAAAVEDRSHLARRVEMLLDTTRNTGTRPLGLRLVAATALIAAVAWGSAQTPQFISFKASAPTQREHLKLIETKTALPQAPKLAQANRPAFPSASPATPLPSAPSATPAKSPAAPETAVNPVIVPVEVRDPLGRFVTGLDNAVFTVQEDGVQQAATELIDEDVRTDLFVLLGAGVDSDAAVRSWLDRSLQASRTVNVWIKPLTDLAHIPQFAPSYAVQMLERNLHQPVHRQAVMIVTNSQGDSSRYSESQLSETLANVDMQVYALDISGPDTVPAASGTDQLSPSAFLTGLAYQSGGQYIAVKRTEELPDLLSKVVIAVRNMYYLSYIPRNTARDGGYRKLQVTLNAPRGVPPLTPQYRPGYTAPTE